MTLPEENGNAMNGRDVEPVAAIDLGSNSFHMVVAMPLDTGEIRIVSKLGEKVQLSAGLNHTGKLSEEAQARGLDCLRRFAQRIQGMPASAVQVVGTSALREALNGEAFIARAEAVLGHEIEIVNGHEEARLVYLGVSHTLADDQGRRLVMDIGGGSTEFIIGERFETQVLESLRLGCVELRDRFFSDGEVTKANQDAAARYACQQLMEIAPRLHRVGWHQCVGSSGTFKSILQAVIDNDLGEEGITRESVRLLQQRLIKLGHCRQLEKLGVRRDRLSVFPAGLAIVSAIFRVLGVDRIQVSEGALREGLVYDMLGRIRHEDVRERSIQALVERYDVDTQRAASVERIALAALRQVEGSLNLNLPFYADLLRWACRIHEVGLAISHSQHHKHGEYLIKNSDLPGFTQRTQQSLATLVRGQRRKFSEAIFNGYSDHATGPLVQLCILIRLAVILQEDRTREFMPYFRLQIEGDEIILEFEDDWLANHPLTEMELADESEQLARMGYQFSFL